MKTTQEMIQVMQHYVNGGKVEHRVTDMEDWESTPNPGWNWHEIEYRIAVPKTKKVKLLAWFDGTYLVYREARSSPAGQWKRIPAEDKIVEVVG